MRSGKLDRTITIKRPVESVEDSGAVSKGWTLVATLRAELVQQSADEFLAGGIEGQTDTVIFRTRYQAGLKVGQQITCNGVTYKLVQIVEIGRRRGLELRAVSA